MNMSIKVLLFGFISLCGVSLVHSSAAISKTGISKCQNESQLYIQWMSPASGMYHYDQRRESYLKSPPGSDWLTYDSFYEFYRSIDGSWKLHEFFEESFYNLKWIPFNGSNPLGFSEDLEMMGDPLKVNDLYMDLNDEGFSAEYGSEISTKIYESVRTISKSSFKVGCPDKCSCEMVNVYGISSGPVKFLRLDIARSLDIYCSSLLSIHNITDSSVYRDTRSSVWQPEVYLSMGCQLLYYNADYDTWYAVWDSGQSCHWTEYFSTDSSPCVEGLPFPTLQTWNTYVETEASRSDVLQHPCHKEYSVEKSTSFRIACACRCSQVEAVFREGSQSKSVIFRRGDSFGYGLNDFDRCQFEIDKFKQKNNKAISNRLASMMDMSWKLDYYISDDCRILYQNIFDNSWLIDFYSRAECESTRFVGKDHSKCVENLPLPANQTWFSTHEMVNDQSKCYYRTNQLYTDLTIDCVDLEL